MSQSTLEVMANSMKQLELMFTQQMDDFKGRVDKSSPSRATTSSISEEFTAFRTFIIGALQLLQNQLHVVSREVDNLEMRSRRKMLLLHGVSEESNEDTTEVIVKTVVQKLKVDGFTKSAISRCHRMGRAAADRPRPILFKLHDTVMKNKVWQAKTSLKSSGITMSEFLTKSRHDTFMAARQRFGVSKCWTKDGCIFIMAPDGARLRVSCQQELDKINLSDAKQAPVPPIVIKEAAAAAAAPKSRRAAAAAARK